MKALPMPFSLLLLLLAASVVSVPTPPGLPSTDVTVHHGTIYQTAKAGDPTQGFIQITNTGAADTLTAAACPLADTTSLAGADGKTITSIDIPAHATVTLAAGQAHIVLRSTHFSVVYGAVVPCSLTFTNAGTLSVFLYAVPAPAS
jgi:copper(I)-binding protein